MSPGTLASTLLRNLLAEKDIVRTGYENKQEEELGMPLQLKKALISLHPLTNFKI